MKIFQNEYDKSTLEKAESLLFNGNGYIGVRGNLEEFYYDHFATNRETYINGFYETKKISYPERMFGFTETGETMISVVDGQTTLISIGNESFRIDEGQVTESTRYLDMERGVTVRELIWTSPQGRKTKLKITRLTSFKYKNIFAMKYEFEKINHNEEIELTTHINFHPVRTIDKNDPRMSHDIQAIKVTEVNQAEQKICFESKYSNQKGKCFWFVSEDDTKFEVTDERVVLTSKLSGNQFVKKLSYSHGNQDHEGFDLSFEQLEMLQKEYLDSFWDVAKIEIESEDDIEESVNFGTYSLLQSLGTNGQTSIAAKGLSGSGYEGHYFWDTEMYIFPVFLHLNPKLAKDILTYRINKLEKARENRKMFGYLTGVLYPWRTISGSESSPFFEAGAAQHHINADIAYAFIRYFESTGDVDLFFDGGFEVLLETSRLFVEIGYMRDESFHIDKVTGPDEYSVLVNDNYYTNAMVQNMFAWVNKLASILLDVDKVRWEKLVKDLAISEDEINQMLIYSEKMAKPFDEKKQIIMQDRDFLNKERWPYGSQTKYPLLIHYHPLTIYRYQVSKQADAVMALMIFPDDQPQEVVKKTVEYYDEVTTHDSSLSYSAFSIVYNRAGNTEKSFKYFLENARCDLDNMHHNTKDGLHTASMGGTFMNIIYGFCDLRFNGDKLTLNPKLPKEIRKIKFSIVFKGEIYRIIVEDGNAVVKKKIV